MNDETVYRQMLLASVTRLTSEWVAQATGSMLYTPEQVLREVAPAAAAFYQALAGMAVVAAPEAEATLGPEPPQPAVSVKKSVTPDFLICLEDGLKFKSLRRHLTTLGLTPAQYRAKWNLPDNYPMVAANYSAKRAELAKSNGLGRK